MDYKQAVERLGGRESRKVMHNTYLQYRDEHYVPCVECGGHLVECEACEGVKIENQARPIALKYHATDVITWHSDGRIVVDVDGWQTSTTKLRLNEFLPDGFRCYSDKGVWYLSQPTGNVGQWEDYPYADGLTLQRNGDGMFHVDMATVGDDPKAVLKMRRKVDKYAKAFVEALRAGKVEPPSAGDCLYCAARTVAGGTPLGETWQAKEHIESHLDESYFVPSLVVRAMEVFPTSQAMRLALAEVWQGEKSTWAHAADTYIWDGIRKNIKRYVLRQLGMAA